jgi:two-component system, chemotaxis family, chemotaxis protein CheY
VHLDTIPPVHLARVLIVEDSSAMRAFLRAALEAGELAGEITEAKSGFEALRVLPRERFDFAFVDINMPDIHGLEVIRLMRASEAHEKTPILVVSSEASPKDLERGMALGADGWLKKPFTSEGLVAAIAAILEKRASSGESGS